MAKAKGTSRTSKLRKSASKTKSPPKAGVRAKSRVRAKPVKLLSDGNPQIGHGATHRTADISNWRCHNRGRGLAGTSSAIFGPRLPVSSFVVDLSVKISKFVVSSTA
jgi:hypothetical protein